MDPAYTPPDIETRQVYGISMQQKRNDAKIDESLFTNIVTQNKEVRNLSVLTLTLSSPNQPLPT
jgi:phosphoribosylaminoimidazolecarboxamide formyltransferase/IMP cyclohydrolase